MRQSGTKLVIALLGLAVTAGALSWWYHYAATHRATRFWGPELAGLIARPSHVEVRLLDTAVSPSQSQLLPITQGESIDLSHARGMVHLRHALMTDRNYNWGESIDSSTVVWKWALRFLYDSQQGLVLLSDDLTAIGKYQSESAQLNAISCRPMADSLAFYFRDLGLLDASKAR